MLPVHTKRYRRFKTNSFATVPQPDYKPMHNPHPPNLDLTTLANEFHV